MSERVVNLTELIDARPVSRLQSLAIIFCGLVMFLDGFDIGTVSTSAPMLAEHIGVRVNTFGPVFSVGFIGVALGSLFFGSIADRVGRKWMIIISALIFGGLTLSTLLVTSFSVLVLVRFLTGLGIGGALPNALALTSEYAPKRSRSFLITAMFTGVPLGGATAPLLGSYFLHHGGWRYIFYFGGIMPIIIALLLILVLPESIRFMVTRRSDSESARKLLTRMFGESAEWSAADNRPVRFVVSDDPHKARAPIVQLMQEGRALPTLLCWVANFMNLLAALFLVSWFPTVLRQSGLPMATGLKIASLLSVGGIIGTPILGRLMDRFSPYRVLTTSFGIAVVVIAMFGVGGTSPLRLAVLTFFAGSCIFGSNAGLLALAASLYPISLRATGCGWVMGIGRLGSIVGPMIGGLMLARHWPLSQVLMVSAVPCLVSCLCIVFLGIMRRTIRAQSAASEASVAGGH